jgi:hypothetical protein
VGGGKKEQLKVEKGKWRRRQRNNKKEGDEGSGRRQNKLQKSRDLENEDGKERNQTQQQNRGDERAGD